MNLTSQVYTEFKVEGVAPRRCTLGVASSSLVRLTSLSQFGAGNVCFCSEWRGNAFQWCSSGGVKVVHIGQCSARLVLTRRRTDSKFRATRRRCFLLARARSPEPRDARARNSLIANCAAGGPRSTGIGRGPRAGPDGSAVFRSPLPVSYLRHGVAAAFCVRN
jgi:hypothetical protein